MVDPVDLETVEQRRQRARNEALGLEMLSQMETQSREILDAAAALERGDDRVQTFASYRTFRERLSEFETFCNVIENQLSRMAADRQGELADLFRKRRAKVFRPAISALNAFFGRMADGGMALPFGLSDVLNSELRAIDDIREIVSQPGALDEADTSILSEIDKLETVVKSLTPRAIGFAEF